MPDKDNQIWHINLGIKLMIFFYIITDDPVTHKVEVVETYPAGGSNGLYSFYLGSTEVYCKLTVALPLTDI